MFETIVNLSSFKFTFLLFSLFLCIVIGNFESIVYEITEELRVSVFLLYEFDGIILFYNVSWDVGF